MSHNSSIPGMGEPVPAIRVINEKQMLLITVGINIMGMVHAYVEQKLTSSTPP
jgi:hypothetical protein